MDKRATKQLEKELNRMAKIGVSRLKIRQLLEPKGIVYWKGYLYNIQSMAKTFKIEIDGVTGVNFNRY